LKPDGYRHRDDYRSVRFWFVGTNLWSFGPRSLGAAAPWVVAEPEAHRRIATVFDTGVARGLPEHASDVMPNLGEFMLRGGWGKDDPFFYMHSGRLPNSNTDEDCNGFKLHNYGRHLLTAQPVYVDGRTQNSHFKNVDNVGAKTAFLTHSDGQPIAGRWHTSAQFDLAEGVYEGAYEDRKGRGYWSTFHTGAYDMKRQQHALGLLAVTNVQRQARQVFFVREPVCWIVVDRVQTPAQHTYEIPFELYTPVDKLDWLRRAQTPLPKAEQRVTLDETKCEIRTDNPGFPKVAMHLFANGPLHLEFDPKSHDLVHKDGGEVRDAEKEWKSNRPELHDTLAFVRRTFVKWSGAGDQVLVTFITTAPADSNARAVWQITGEGTRFTASAPDGAKIDFAASIKSTTLKAGIVTTEGDALLVVQPKTGAARGRVLGERSGEFSFDGQLKITREIFAPIKPVTFTPDVNVFCDHTEVAMNCATPGVEIRYTLDGSEPTLQSPRYEKPVRLTASTVVRARAMRPGAHAPGWAFDPGYAALPTRAVFTQQKLWPAAPVAATQPGLAWDYAEGQPFALVANSALVPAQKTGITEKLLAVAMHTNGSAFVARYRGFLVVPSDGVYTFHAPRELVIPDCDPGYDLRVLVDGAEWWPALRWHALGTWSRALAKGPHAFEVIFVDTRTVPYKHETWQNWPNLAVLWKGVAPVLEISGPQLPRQTVPAAWLRRAP
ncbi:MAG: chitobiase/beta-hexosaminidase C-terminal domain-containing protein, partial [Kiritimatiellaeota bacterium]|nr:chitobiase/beta-hexosaminidase C-terminal domain-containing protein [Kiritimatiellota bacterium]